MTKLRCVLTLTLFSLLALPAASQSLLDGTTFQASIYNMPESIGAVRLVDTADSNCRSGVENPVEGNDVATEACLIQDSGTDPITITFNAGTQDLGDVLSVDATAESFAGLSEPIVVANAATGQQVPLPVWERSGDLLEFTLRTKNNTLPAEDDEDFWGFSATGIQYPNAAPDSEIEVPYDAELGNYTNFYFWFEDEDGPIENYDIFLPVGIGAGNHPTEDREVVFILYSENQTDEQTDTPPGGSMEFHSHGSILDENPMIGNLLFLADGVGVENALDITGIGLGFLINPPDILQEGLAGDFDNDNELTANDINLLSAQVGMGDLTYDLDGNGVVDNDDRVFWVEELAGSLFGDTNLDKTVNFSDFISLSANYNQDGGWAEGDADGSGAINFSDFITLSTNYNMSTLPPAAVPEPTAWTMLGSFVLLGIMRRRRLPSC